MDNYLHAKSPSRHPREGGDPWTFAFLVASVQAKSMGSRLTSRSAVKSRGNDGSKFNVCWMIS